MPLNGKQKELISRFIPIFKDYLAAEGRKVDLEERWERIKMYDELLIPDGIQRITELEFGKIISSLWSFAMWGNQGYLVNKLLQDNPLDEIKAELQNLLWGQGTIAQRYDHFRQKTFGFGPATISELLSFTHPDDCGLWNTRARNALRILGFADVFPLQTNQINGQQYERFNTLLREIQNELNKYDLGNLDLLGVDYFLFEVQQAEPEIPATNGTEMAVHGIEAITDFDHSEAIEMLLTIGQWLGFEVEKEKIIATGARVDTIWQARVANLGVVTYVFEVQRRGSIDSLILNLQRAQNNPTVQRLIVVAMESDLINIQREVNSLREDFRRMVGYMGITELIKATDLVIELSGIINKLDLVKSEFGI